jgi:FTR1 family protein
MIAIAFITFRESLEMLLVGSVLLASLEQSGTNKKRDLLLGSAVGLLFSFTLFLLFAFAGSKVRFDMSKDTSEIFESINYIGSGIFLFISAILLHNKLKHFMAKAPSLLLDTSLFAVGFLLVLREGMEIIVFSISTSILSTFASSFLGFILGILATISLGFFGNKFLHAKLSHKKILVVADWGIKFLSLYFVAKGLMGISEFFF